MMSKVIVQTEKAPEAIGPYSQAVKVGNTLFTSGQIGVDPKKGAVVGEDIKSQAEQVMKNLKAVIEEAGMNMTAVVKTTCFLSNMDDFKEFNAVYAKYFNINPPARSTVAVKTLPLNVKVEVEAIAVVD